MLSPDGDSDMNPDNAPYAIIAWFVLALAIFPSLPPHRGILAIVFSGMLFLPEIQPTNEPIVLGPLKFTKANAIAFAGLFATLLYDSGRLFGLGFVPRWFDLPMIAWCLWSIPSCLSNGATPKGIPAYHDAISQTIGTTITWGVPYLIGRIYFTDRVAVKELAVWTIYAAVLYVPFILWEARMSPQLHVNIYGFAQHDFHQHVRFGGYRPMVFFSHGLVLGMFIACATLLALWLRRPLGLPAYLFGLIPIVLLMRSTGAVVLGLVGGFVLWVSTVRSTRAALLALACVFPAYAVARTTGAWSGNELVDATAVGVEAERAQSLEFRFKNENILIQKALEKPIAGWGGWGRARVYDEWGKDISITDGLWIISMGDRGVVGLMFLGLAMILPIIRFARGVDPRSWHSAAWAPGAGLAVVSALWVINNLPNAISDPFWIMLGGALTSFHLWPDETQEGELATAAPIS